MIAARLDDARQPAVVEFDIVLDAALAAEREPHLAAIDRHMPIAQRRQAERAILLARIRRCRRGSASSRAAARPRASTFSRVKSRLAKIACGALA